MAGQPIGLGAGSHRQDHLARRRAAPNDGFASLRRPLTDPAIWALHRRWRPVAIWWPAAAAARPEIILPGLGMAAAGSRAGCHLAPR